jgi:hypothetical protein
MRVSNSGSEQSHLDQLTQFQVDFQTRLAEETMRYLRRFQAMFEPHAPGTAVRSNAATLEATATIGEAVEMRLDIENCQRVHTSLTIALTPLVVAGRTAWFPATTITPATRLISPGETAEVLIRIALPDELTPGTYRGLAILQGFHAPGIPVSIKATEP